MNSIYEMATFVLKLQILVKWYHVYENSMLPALGESFIYGQERPLVQCYGDDYM